MATMSCDGVTTVQGVVDRKVCEWSRVLSEREGKRVGVNGEEGHSQGGRLTGSRV